MDTHEWLPVTHYHQLHQGDKVRDENGEGHIYGGFTDQYDEYTHVFCIAYDKMTEDGITCNVRTTNEDLIGHYIERYTPKGR